MKHSWNPLLIGGCNVLGVALLVLSVSAGGSTVRAAGDTVVLDSAALEPLMKLAEVFQQRVAKIEVSLAAVAEAMTTRRVVTRELCVADESGAQTCITKAQLDYLMKTAAQAQAQTVQAQTVQAPPVADADTAPQAAPQPQVVPASRTAEAAETGPREPAACQEKCVAPDAAIAAAPPEMPSTAPPAATVAGAPAAEEVPAPAPNEAGKDAEAPAELPATDQQPAAEPPAVSVPTPRPESTGAAPHDAAAVDAPPASGPND